MICMSDLQGHGDVHARPACELAPLLARSVCACLLGLLQDAPHHICWPSTGCNPPYMLKQSSKAAARRYASPELIRQWQNVLTAFFGRRWPLLEACRAFVEQGLHHHHPSEPIPFRSHRSLGKTCLNVQTHVWRGSPPAKVPRSRASEAPSAGCGAPPTARYLCPGKLWCRRAFVLHTDRTVQRSAPVLASEQGSICALAGSQAA